MTGRFTLRIRGRLFLVMFLTAIVAVTVGVAYESARYTRALQEWAAQEVASVTDALAQDFLNLIVLGSPDGAANLVERLKSFPLIQRVVLYTGAGDALFQYQRESDAVVRAMDDYFTVRRDIRVQDAVYGRVEIEASGARLRRDISDYYQYLALLFVALTAVTAASAWYFQRYFTGPLLQLTDFMHRVAQKRDFAQRVTTDRRDEYGVVFGGLNELLDEMQLAQQKLADEYFAKEEALSARYHAESANREKSAFLASMSHELRTPLNAIIGYSELLEEDAAADGNTAAATDLKKIHAAGKHLLALINDVLDLSKVEAGKMKLELTEVAPARLVDDVCDMVRPLLARGRNTLRKEIAADDVVMFTDSMRLRQILFNLLSNAGKFTQDGTITLALRVDGERAYFSVSDTGVGMTPAEVDTLFQPFVQAESGGKKHEGTGLGLALCKRFCELLGGEIGARSTPGQGATFEFWLPLRLASLPAKQ